MLEDYAEESDRANGIYCVAEYHTNVRLSFL